MGSRFEEGFRERSFPKRDCSIKGFSVGSSLFWNGLSGDAKPVESQTTSGVVALKQIFNLPTNKASAFYFFQCKMRRKKSSKISKCDKLPLSWSDYPELSDASRWNDQCKRFFLIEAQPAYSVYCECSSNWILSGHFAQVQLEKSFFPSKLGLEARKLSYWKELT